ncbi:MAG TPA: BamA/TamA family outer membrane protein, partial [Bacteroidota bacterium]|nr:BamA/TamA family outer membrane protein [Bacteroidota bacterium]
TPEAVQYDESRIASLGLFNRVKILATPITTGKAALVVSVREQWYVYPFPILGIKYRDWSNIYYGLGVTHENFRGRDEKLSAIAVLGFEPWGSLRYRNPFLDDNGTYSLTTSISYNRINNKSLRVPVPDSVTLQERHFTPSVAFGRRFDNFNTAMLSAEYDVIEMSQYYPGTTLSPTGIDRFPVFMAGYTYDTRDLIEYPQNGAYVRLTMTTYGLPSDEVHNIRYAFDLRRDIPFYLGGMKLTWATRIYGNILHGGPTASYNRVFFGYDERIRGHFDDIVEGEDLSGISSELHLPLIDPIFFTVPYLPPEFNLWKFGMTLAVFGDAGEAWFRGDPVGWNQALKGYGASLDFLLMFNAVLRLEYGLNEVRKGQFIFEGGLAF